MAASTVPAAKAAILEALKTRPALNEVQITWGEPTETEDLGDALIFFDSEPVTRQPEWRVLGTGQLDETYIITLVVRNRLFGDEPADVEQRCWELIDQVEQQLRLDPHLGGILSDSQDARALSFDEQQVRSSPLSDGWMAEGTVPLVCHARI